MGGGSQTSETKVPEWLEAAAKANIDKANTIAGIGYTPYYGPDVAAMTPMQMSAMQGTNQFASAFGMPTADLSAGMPQATNYGGMSAYSSGSGYDQALAELKRNNPGQYEAITNLFINPQTGAQSVYDQKYAKKLADAEAEAAKKAAAATTTTRPKGFDGYR